MIYNKLILFIVLSILTLIYSCKKSYFFVPIDKDYFNNLQFDSVKIQIDYLSSSCCVEDIMLQLRILNPSHKKIIINKNINIKGKYFETNNINQWGFLEKDGDKKKYGTILEDHFVSISPEIVIEYFSHLESIQDEDISYFNIIKDEIFIINFPDINIDDKEYSIQDKKFHYIKNKEKS